MSERAARSEIVLRPIGSVASVVSEVKPMRDAWAEVVSEVRVAPEFAAGLEGLDGFSHALIVYWMDQVPAARRRAVGAPAPGSAGPPAGTFALRTPTRPNPVGVSTVQLLGIAANVLFDQWPRRFSFAEAGYLYPAREILERFFLRGIILSLFGFDAQLRLAMLDRLCSTLHDS